MDSNDDGGACVVGDDVDNSGDKDGELDGDSDDGIVGDVETFQIKNSMNRSD